MAPKRQIVRQADADVHALDMSSPVEIEGEVVSRFSKVIFPLVQLEEVTFEVLSDSEISFLCSDSHANFVASVEEQVATTIAEKSVAWFGKSITCDQCEKMLRSSLDGHKNPKHTVSCEKLRVFDHLQNPCELTSSGCSVPILRIEGVLFYEKHCELLWSAVQMKLSEDLPLPNEEEEEEDDPSEWVGN
jgi:hypothetical protein